MIRLGHTVLVVLLLALAMGASKHGMAAAGMEPAMASAAMTANGGMGDCVTCTGKPMKSGELCSLACSTLVAVTLLTRGKPDFDLRLVDYGIIPNLLAVGRVPAVNLSPPRTISLI